MLYDLLVYKIDKMPNGGIANKLNSTYNANHSEYYLLYGLNVPKLEEVIVTI